MRLAQLLLSPIRRLMTRRGSAIHCIGDSHSSFFSGQDTMQDEWPKRSKNRWPFFRAYRLGPALAYNLIRSGTTSRGREKMLAVLSGIPKGERVLLCYGEIDCRAHLLKQAQAKSVAPESLVEECVDRYMQAVLDVRQRDYNVMVWNVVPPTTLTGDEWAFPVSGSFEDRMKVTRYFNQCLAEACSRAAVPFVSIFDQLLGQDGTPDHRYFSDRIHLSSEAIQFAVAELRRSCPEISFAAWDTSAGAADVDSPASLSDSKSRAA